MFNSPCARAVSKATLGCSWRCYFRGKKRLEFTQLVNICVFLPYLAGNPQIFFDIRNLVNFPHRMVPFPSQSNHRVLRYRITVFGGFFRKRGGPIVLIFSTNNGRRTLILGSIDSLHANAGTSLRVPERFPNQEREKNGLIKTPFFGVYPFFSET